MAIEKLTMDDAYVMEVVISKINEIIDRVEEMEDDYDRRISAHWKFHRKEQEEKATGLKAKKGKQATWKTDSEQPASVLPKKPVPDGELEKE